MGKDRLSFLGHNNLNLAAELDTPDEREQKYIALYAPCFTCTKNLRSVKYITQGLNKSGISLFRFDFPGLGESEGDFAETNFTTNLENLRAAPKLLIGHSLGGAAMMRLAMEFDSVEAVTVIAAPDNPSHLAEKLSVIRDKASLNGSAEVTIGGIKFDLKKQFFDDLYANGKIHDLSKVTKPVLVMHSPDDDTIDRDHSIGNFTKTNGKNAFITLNDVGHLMMEKKDAFYVGSIISRWAKAFIK